LKNVMYSREADWLSKKYKPKFWIRYPNYLLHQQ